MKMVENKKRREKERSKNKEVVRMKIKRAMGFYESTNL